MDDMDACWVWARAPNHYWASRILGPKYSSSAYITQPVSILVSVIGIRLAEITVDADGLDGEQTDHGVLDSCALHTCSW
jgi:hypothetical protein